jgi:predicted DNA-binding transcriptional regulator AlpA
MAKGPARFGWPRGLRRTEAAEYIGISTTKFDEMIADGRMPQPKQIDARRVWDRHQLDRYFEDLPGGSDENPFDGVDVWSEQNKVDDTRNGPGGYPIIRDPSHPLRKWYDQLGFDPATMGEDDMRGLMAAATERWKASVPSTPLGKREQRALRQLAAQGLGVAVDCNEIKDCGPDTQARLEARGFLETRPRAKYPDRIGSYVLTEAGLQAWKELADGR